MCIQMTKSKKLKLEIVGNTESGTRVVNGSRIFKLVESVGLPLDIILLELEKENIIIDWIQFYETGLKSNWTSKKIFEKIEVALIDVGNKGRALEILKRLKYYIMNRT